MSLFRINTNTSALFAQNHLRRNNRRLMDAQRSLSSGRRINSASDDAAGLAVSQKLTTQIRGFEMATRNAQDTISMLQTADGALGEIQSNLQRMRELSVQAANDTLTDEDREKIQAEVDQLAGEIQRIVDQTQFNEKNLLDGGLKDVQVQVGPNENETINFSIGNAGTGESALNLAEHVSFSLPNPGRPDNVGQIGDITFSSDWDITTDPSGDYRVRETKTAGGEPKYELVATENAPDPEGTVIATSVAHDEPSDLPGVGTLAGEPHGPVKAGIIWRGQENTVFEDNDGDLAVMVTNHQFTEGTMRLNDSGEPIEDGSTTQEVSLNQERANLEAGNYTVRRTDPPSADDMFLELISPEGKVVGVTENDILNTHFAERFYKPGTIGTPQEEVVLDLTDVLGQRTMRLDAGGAEDDNPFRGGETIRIGGQDISSSTDAASSSIGRFDEAIEAISERRADIGALINRLETTISVDSITHQNLKSARSRIRDADVAQESVRRTRNNILVQAGTSVLAQANQSPQLALQLLQ
jgi:flagellin